MFKDGGTHHGCAGASRPRRRSRAVRDRNADLELAPPAGSNPPFRTGVSRGQANPRRLFEHRTSAALHAAPGRDRCNSLDSASTEDVESRRTRAALSPSCAPFRATYVQQRCVAMSPCVLVCQERNHCAARVIARFEEVQSTFRRRRERRFESCRGHSLRCARYRSPAHVRGSATGAPSGAKST
jgi:hypothetical protein